MAQRQYRLNLDNTEFPLLSEQQGRTVIGSISEETALPENRPFVQYMHNVLPTRRGLRSVGYKTIIPAISPATSNLDDVRIIYGSDRSRLYLAWDSFGNAYALKEGATAWVAIAGEPTVSEFTADKITVGTVDGISYIYYANTGCYKFNPATNNLNAVSLTGLVIADIVGVIASSGYLIAYTENSIAWSSTITPTDFTPSSVTGAGGGNVAGIGGGIKFCLSNSLGIIAYTESNAIAGTYTGNVQYPFKFREIDASKGGISLDLVAYEANAAAQFIFTKAGLQSVTSQKAIAIIPEVTDFLAGSRFEDLDESTLVFTHTNLVTAMKKKVKFIASRYLVISYGITSFTHAIVYDTALEKLGKLKIDHADCLEYLGSQTEVAKESLAFLLSTGEIKFVDISTSAVNSSGALILGKLQYTKATNFTLQHIEVENVPLAAALTVTDMYSLDGKTTVNTTGYLAETAEGIRKYNFRVAAKNHTFAFVGEFDLNTVIATYNTSGRR